MVGTWVCLWPLLPLVSICHHLSNKLYPSYIPFTCKEEVFLPGKSEEWAAPHSSRRPPVYPSPSGGPWGGVGSRGIGTLRFVFSLWTSWHHASLRNIHVISRGSKWIPLLSHNTPGQTSTVLQTSVCKATRTANLLPQGLMVTDSLSETESETCHVQLKSNSSC